MSWIEVCKETNVRDWFGDWFHGLVRAFEVAAQVRVSSPWQPAAVSSLGCQPRAPATGNRYGSAVSSATLTECGVLTSNSDCRANYGSFRVFRSRTVSKS